MKKVVGFIMIFMICVSLFGQFTFINENGVKKAKNYYSVIMEEKDHIAFSTKLSGVEYEIAFMLQGDMENYEYSFLAVQIKEPPKNMSLREQYENCEKVFEKLLSRVGLSSLKSRVINNFNEVFETQLKGNESFDKTFTYNGTTLRTRIMQFDNGLALGLFEFQPK